MESKRVENTPRAAASTDAPGRPSARQLIISNFDVRAVWMERVTSSLAIQEVELVKLQAEVDKLVANNLDLDPPEELIKARVENEKLKYGIGNPFLNPQINSTLILLFPNHKVPTEHLEKGGGERIG